MRTKADGVGEDRGSQQVRTEARFRGLFDAPSVGVALFDPDGRLRRVNCALADMLHRPPEELAGADWSAFTDPSDAGAATALFEDLRAGRRSAGELALRCRRPDGDVRHLLLTVAVADPSALADADADTDTGSGGDAAAAGFVGHLVDLTDVVRAESARASSDARLRAVVDNVQDLVFEIDTAGRWSFLNRAWTALTGIPVSEAVGRPALEWVAPDDVAEVRRCFVAVITGAAAVATCRVRLQPDRGEPQEVDVRLQARHHADGHGVAGATGVARPVTDHSAAHRRLRHQALHDPVTGLPNRGLVLERLEDLRRTGAEVGVLVVDVDRFTTVNEALGRGAGDALLRELGRRLAGAAGPGWTVGRFGGDELVVLAPDPGGRAGLRAVGERLRGVVRAPVEVAARLMRLEASIGAALVGPGSDDAAGDVLHHADLAKVHAKRLGRGRVELFEPALLTAVDDRLLVETELRLALATGAVVPHYQPVVDVPTGAVVAYEALARWDHPERGLLGADSFVAAAEQASLVAAIGEHVLDRVITDLADPRRPFGDATVAVNLSARQLGDPALPGRVLRRLAAEGLEPGRLAFEVTESLALDDVAATGRILSELAAAGVAVSVDDFGTGYSSLAQLRDLPVGALKVDRAFVARLDDDPRDRTLLAAIVAMAHAMGLLAVAEGVERPSQLAVLRELGCDRAQGFLLGVPQPLERLVAPAPRAAQPSA